MTTFPAAAQYAAEAIKSLLAGTVLPDRLVLYVTLSQFGPEGLPEALKKLERENPVFEIRDYERDIRSYRKLVPALRDFPEAVIVTVDDDVRYDPRMLEDILTHHLLFPDYILAHRAKRIEPEKPYKKWKKFRWYHFLFGKVNPSYRNLQTGVGGVLYPPHSLKKEMIDEELFTRLAPTTDDIWFWGAAVANGRKLMPVAGGRHNKPKGVGKPDNLSLKRVNFKRGEDRNLAAFKAILAAYPEIKERVDNELQ